MKSILDLNVFSVIVIISSIALVLYPLVYMEIAEREAKIVKENFEKIEFALRHFFYNEGFEVITPSKVGIDTLVQRYYLSRYPGGDYSILWIDPDPSDGKIEAAIVYGGKIDPVAALKVIKDPMWFDPKEKKLYEDYREGRQVAVIVEVSG